MMFKVLFLAAALHLQAPPDGIEPQDCIGLTHNSGELLKYMKMEPEDNDPANLQAIWDSTIAPGSPEDIAKYIHDWGKVLIADPKVETIRELAHGCIGHVPVGPST